MTIDYVPTIAEVAYSAGFFDGEGCISIILAKQGPRLSIASASIYRPVLDEMEGWWGGGIYGMTANDKRGWAPCWQWHLNGREDRLRFLEAILPYLRVKRRAAEIAIDFLALRSSRSETDGRRLSNETLEGRHALLLKLRALPYRKSTPAQQLERVG